MDNKIKGKTNNEANNKMNNKNDKKTKVKYLNPGISWANRWDKLNDLIQPIENRRSILERRIRQTLIFEYNDKDIYPSYLRNQLGVKFNPGVIQCTTHNFTVKIRIKKFSEREWSKIFDILSQHCYIYLVMIEENEFIFNPEAKIHSAVKEFLKMKLDEDFQSIDEIFRREKIDVVPKSFLDMRISCNCGVSNNLDRLCNHVKPAFNLIGKRLKANPFLFLIARGKSFDEISKAISLRLFNYDYDKELMKEKKTAMNINKYYEFWNGSKTVKNYSRIAKYKKRNPPKDCSAGKMDNDNDLTINYKKDFDLSIRNQLTEILNFYEEILSDASERLLKGVRLKNIRY